MQFRMPGDPTVFNLVKVYAFGRNRDAPWCLKGRSAEGREIYVVAGDVDWLPMQRCALSR